MSDRSRRHVASRLGDLGRCKSPADARQFPGDYPFTPTKQGLGTTKPPLSSVLTN